MALTPDDLREAVQAYLDRMPPYYEYEDPFVRAVLMAQASEFEALRRASRDLVVKAFPQHATSDPDLLSYWETQLGIPSDPTLSIVARQQLVMARIKQRKASSETAWAEAVTSALGTAQWSYATNFSTGVVTITLPFTGSSAAAVVRARPFIRAVTPAHLSLNYIYGQGFVFDDSPFDSGQF